ncbi:MAG: TetR/AcrR family transcriptional regulator [Aureispira sp.]
MTTSLDPQIERTRSTLKNSLSTLLKAKRYQNISIQQILEHAKISRSTFYGHFPSKNALLYSLEGQLPIQLEAALLENKATNLLDLLFQHVETSYTGIQKDLLKVILPEITYWVVKYIHDYCQRAWKNYSQLDLWEPVAIAGITSLLKMWLEQGAKNRKEVVVKANDLLFCCIENAL